MSSDALLPSPARLLRPLTVLRDRIAEAIGLRTDAVLDALEARLAFLRPPRRIAPTRAGWFALLAPFVLGMAAINASNNLLFLLLAAALGAIVISGVLSERALRGVEIQVEPLGSARAGETARLAIRIRRTRAAPGSPPAFGLQVRERATRLERRAEPPLDVFLPPIEGVVGHVVATRHFPRRGRAELESFEVRTSYPFGLLSKARDVDAAAVLIVRPRAVPVPAAIAEPLGAAEGGRAAAQRGLGTDVYGLREWEEWDSVHRIHALRSMALDRDVVIETESTRRPVAWLGLCNTEGADPLAFERSLEIAAATLEAWDAQGHAVGLRTASRVWAPGSTDLEGLLDAVALMQLESGQRFVDDGEPLWIVPKGASRPIGDRISCAVVDAEGRLELEEGV